MLSSTEIQTMITALGTGIGKDEFNIEKLRYHKVIIMTDADVDGSHIRTLLMTFFYRFMPSLVDNGYLFIAQPPLYRLKKGSKEWYVTDQKEYEKFILDNGIGRASLDTNGDTNPITGARLIELMEKVFRFKGIYDRCLKIGFRSNSSTLSLKTANSAPPTSRMPKRAFPVSRPPCAIPDS